MNTLPLLSFLSCWLLLLPSFPGAGPSPSAEPQATQPAASRGLRDAAELEAFLDGVIEAQKEALHIAGATIAVVKDNELFFAKGYGYEDIGKMKKVDPARSLFRIGSVSKLFTWTAVMQLVQQGKLDLNRDVNDYLVRFKVPGTYPEPITLTHLLTHTPGFEDQVIGLFSRTADSMRPPGDILADELPARVRPPGQLASYSNHGTALAGYIVQEVSGIPWDEYIERNILKPLGMKHTTVRQPVPSPLSEDMSVGYRFQRGEFKPQGFEFVPAAPAGSMSASAVDMAYFMIAHLQEGRFGSAQILSEKTSRLMHSRLFGHTEKLNGMLHGFYEMNRNGERIYGHGGDTLWFHTELALFPERRTGLFVSFNSDTGAKARSNLVDAFINHYFPPREAADLKSIPGSRERAYQVAGSYRSLRYSHNSLAKLAALFGTANVSVAGDGCLLSTGLSEYPKRWVEVEPFVFQAVDGHERVVFRPDGDRMHLFVGETPFLAFERLSGLDIPARQYGLAGVSAGVLLLALIAWPIAAYRKRHSARFGVGAPRGARLTGWFLSLLLLGFGVGLAVILADPQQIVFGIPPALRILLALPMAALILMVPVAIYMIFAWVRGYWQTGGRVFYTLVAFSGAALIWWLNYWNLLGYHFK